MNDKQKQVIRKEIEKHIMVKINKNLLTKLNILFTRFFITILLKNY